MMQSTEAHSARFSTVRRVTFLDSLRYLFVFGVVLQHAGMAYNGSGWWPVENGFSITIGLLTTLTDGVLMPGLFYISGYFAVPSINRKGGRAFFMGKLRRLGIPWLLCSLFVCPILPLVYHYTHDGMRLTRSYLSTWVKVMGNACGLNIGILPPMAQVMRNDLFYQRYMWFISVLILFFLIFSLFYMVKRDWFASQDFFKPHALWVRSTFRLIPAIGSITFLGSLGLIALMFLLAPDVSNPESWFTLGNLVQFRVSRIFLHGTYFVLGVLTYKWRLIQQGCFPGPPKNWLGFFFIILVLYLASKILLVAGPGRWEPLFQMAFWLCLNFFTISALGLTASLALKYLNQPTVINRSLATNSYPIYLAHYIFVIGFQMLFFNAPAAPVLKYLLVFGLSLLAAYGSSRFLITPYPRFTAISLAVLSGMMLIILRP